MVKARARSRAGVSVQGTGEGEREGLANPQPDRVPNQETCIHIHTHTYASQETIKIKLIDDQFKKGDGGPRFKGAPGPCERTRWPGRGAWTGWRLRAWRGAGGR